MNKRVPEGIYPSCCKKRILLKISEHNIVVAEERFCLKKYEKAYREYMDRTPRWIGIPKSSKS